MKEQFKVSLRRTPFSPISSRHTFAVLATAIKYARIIREHDSHAEVVIVDTIRHRSVAY